MKKACLLLAGIVTASVAVSQDIHFSQFYASPLTLNPAITGRMNGDYRLAAIYRGQWKSVTSDPSFTPYATPAASFDIPFIFGKKRNQALGAGILLVNDITNNKRLNTLHALVSVSYIKVLDNNFNHQLSIGLQGGIQQSSIKTSEFVFESQLTTPGNPLADPIANANDSKTIPDINAGVLYSGRVIKKLTLFTGFSLFHIGEPNQSFFNNGESKLPMRYVVHGGLDWGITGRLSLLPGVIFMAQEEAREINFGTNLGIEVSEKPGKEATLYAGGWYRWDDAVIPMLGVELLKRFRVGLSYDVNISSLSDATNSKGGFEVSLIYVGRIVRLNEANLFCPRF
ncbi:MAG TPA: PorP/SprF family type IX secretion system membrane protein [Chitinophagales bacterium]|nr:PorP/SprF family type IX secretion system membrane protein [Chitinophagales bacterium]